MIGSTYKSLIGAILENRGLRVEIIGHFSPEGLGVATKTIERVVTRAVQLYEEEPGEAFAPSGSVMNGTLTHQRESQRESQHETNYKKR
jgi:hypothetical protein